MERITTSFSGKIEQTWLYLPKLHKREPIIWSIFCHKQFILYQQRNQSVSNSEQNVIRNKTIKLSISFEKAKNCNDFPIFLRNISAFYSDVSSNPLYHGFVVHVIGKRRRCKQPQALHIHFYRCFTYALCET